MSDTTYPERRGSWVVYDIDHGPYAIALHDNVLDAVYDVSRRGYAKIAFWPFGLELADAIRRWEEWVSTQACDTEAHGSAPSAPVTTAGPDDRRDGTEVSGSP